MVISADVAGLLLSLSVLIFSQVDMNMRHGPLNERPYCHLHGVAESLFYSLHLFSWVPILGHVWRSPVLHDRQIDKTHKYDQSLSSTSRRNKNLTHLIRPGSILGLKAWLKRRENVTQTIYSQTSPARHAPNPPFLPSLLPSLPRSLRLCGPSPILPFLALSLFPFPPHLPRCHSKNDTAPPASICHRILCPLSQCKNDLPAHLYNSPLDYPPSNSHSHPDCQFFRNPQVQYPEVALKK